jgi:hypothetical protein
MLACQQLKWAFGAVKSGWKVWLWNNFEAGHLPDTCIEYSLISPSHVVITTPMFAIEFTTCVPVSLKKYAALVNLDGFEWR